MKESKLKEIKMHPRTQIELLCPNKHRITKTYDEIRQSNLSCFLCRSQEVEVFVKKEGWFLKSQEMLPVNPKLGLKCPNGHYMEMTFNDFKQGKRCKKCIIPYDKDYQKVKEIIESQGWFLLSKSG